MKPIAVSSVFDANAHGVVQNLPVKLMQAQIKEMSWRNIGAMEKT